MLSRLLGRHADRSFTLLRVLAGAMFAFHGVQKIFGVMTDHGPPVGSQLWIGGIIELVSGTAIALGAFVPCAALLASGTMAVAYVQFHWRLDGGAKFFPTVNRGELALLYSLVFLFIACQGAGPWSIDALRQEKRAGRKSG